MKQVEFRQVSKVFAAGGQKIVALREVSFAVGPGEFWTIIGPSGSGKTTLLRCLAGFEKPTSGEILVAGRRVTGPGRDRMMVFQDLGQLFPWHTVLGNVLLALRLAWPDKSRKECCDLARFYLRLVGLEEYVHLYPHQLSGGMKQRVAIARALGVQPAVLLMDEPFASLDAITRAGLTAELLNIWSETRVTVIFVTHNIEEALITADHIVVLARGGSVRALVPNDLPRPRQVEDPAFAAARQRLHELLGQVPTLPGEETAHEREPEGHPLVRPAPGGVHLS